MTQKMIVVMLAALLVLLPSVTAQEEQSAFQGMLSRVPGSAGEADEAGFVYLKYVDWAAMVEARAGGALPADWAEFMAWDEAQDANFEAWIAAVPSATTAPSALRDIRTYATAGERAEAVMGFDLFDIRRAVEFGPGLGLMLGGDFDAEAIAAAHQAREYTQETIHGLTVWCGPLGGCEGGDVVDDSPKEIDPETFSFVDENSLIHQANLFGGRRRQQHPVLVDEGVVASHINMTMIESMAATATGEAPSVLDVPPVGAIATALDSLGGTVAQALFVGGSENGTVLPRNLDAIGLSAEDFSALPRFEMAAMSMVIIGGEELSVVALAYADEAAAHQAAPELAHRIRTLTYLGFDRPDQNIIDDLSVEVVVDEPQVLQVADRWVVLGVARNTIPDGLLPSGLLFIRWYQAQQSGLFTPLWADHE